MLSPDVIAYDHPEFLANRAPLIRPGLDCGPFTPDVLTKLDLPGGHASGYRNPTYGNSECSLSSADYERDLDIKVSAPAKRFEEFWAARISEPDAQTAEAPGRGGFLYRRIISGRYYAVAFPANSDEDCAVAIDTGAPTPILVNVGSKFTQSKDHPGKNVRTPDQIEKFCAPTLDFSTRMLTVIDPGGGSRAT